MADALRALDTLGPDRAAKLFRRHKVRTLVAERLAEHPESAAGTACLDQLAPDLEKLRTLRDGLPAMLELVETAAKRLAIPVVIFKGVAAREWYPDPAWRDFGDLDLFVRSWADALALARHLRLDLGFTLDRGELPWVKQNVAAGSLYGQFLLADPDSGRMGVDIHYGAYSVRHCHHLPIRVPDSPGLHFVRDSDNVAAVVNNAAGDHFASMKEVNDLLLAADRSVDEFTEGAETARLAKLDNFLSILVSLAGRTSSLSDSQEAAFAPLRRRVVTEPAPPVTHDSWTRRWVATSLHSFRVGRDTSVADGVRLAVSAVRYYRKRLSLSTVDDEKAARPPTELNEYTCVRLVPLELLAPRTGGGPYHRRSSTTGRHVDDGLTVIPTPGGDVFAVGEELFVPTVFYQIPAGHVRSAVTVSDAGGDGAP